MKEKISVFNLKIFETVFCTSKIIMGKTGAIFTVADGGY